MSIAQLKQDLKKAKANVAQLESKIANMKPAKPKKGVVPIDEVRARIIKLLTSGYTTEEVQTMTGCRRQQVAAVKAWISRQGRKYIKKA